MNIGLHRTAIQQLKSAAMIPDPKEDAAEQTRGELAWITANQDRTVRTFYEVSSTANLFLICYICQ